MKQSKHKALRLFIIILRTQSKAALHKNLCDSRRDIFSAPNKGYSNSLHFGGQPFCTCAIDPLRDRHAATLFIRASNIL